jgi:uncharacterized membrane protein YagU involved in acid resistance
VSGSQLRNNESLMEATYDGLVAGLIATVPMTAVMKAVHRRLPLLQRYRLPPEQITQSIAKKAGLDNELDRRKRRVLTLISHYGYGALWGAAFRTLTRVVPVPAFLGGPGFGFCLWAASYLGWLPATGIRRSAAKEPAGRNAMMIAAHLVWGATTSLLCEAMRRRREGKANRVGFVRRSRAWMDQARIGTGRRVRPSDSTAT